jgi:hypothetical protein
VENRRHIVCLNPKQARKDAAERESILAGLEAQPKAPKASLETKDTGAISSLRRAARPSIRQG